MSTPEAPTGPAHKSLSVWRRFAVLMVYCLVWYFLARMVYTTGSVVLVVAMCVAVFIYPIVSCTRFVRQERRREMAL